MGTRATIKHSLLRGAEIVGLTDWLARSSWRQARMLILCYHGVSVHDEHLFNPELYVSQEFLRARFELLRAHGANVLPLGEALDRVRAGTLPPRSVVLTFDDGAANFATRAVPLLREFSYPATVYVATHYVMEQRPVWNVAARYLVWAATHSGRTRPEVLDPHLFGTSAVTKATPEMIVKSFLRRWEHGTSEEKDEALSRLAGFLSYDDTKLRAERLWHLMTPDQVTSLPQDLVSVQLHTHRHRQPGERQAYAEEIVRNRAVIQQLTSTIPMHFCYPSGIVEPAFPGYLRELDIRSSVTCAPGLASPFTDRFLLPRLVDTMETPRTTFQGMLSGTAAMLIRP